jgi:hypothetical protein
MSMDSILKKMETAQLAIILLVMLVGFGVTWGKTAGEINQVKAEKIEIVAELKKIREEIVRLRIETAVMNQKLQDHITTNGE